MWQALLGDDCQTRPRARVWTGGDAPTRDGGRVDEVYPGDELDDFVTASHGGNCGTAASIDGTSTEGNEPNEKRGVAVVSKGWCLDAGAGGSLRQLPRNVDERG